MEKIGEIKARFAEAGERLKKASMRTEAESVAGLLENLEQTYREDTRSGVQALIRRSEKQREALEKETARIYQLQQYERDYENEGLICGIDEVGRGPLAGPEHAVAVGIGIVSPQRIDEINILQATYEAMRQAIEKLNPQPAVLLNDAVRIPQVAIQQVPIIKGDAKSVSIAAASIVAKVTRDRMMEQYEEVFPGYGFARNKGYGSKEHIETLQTMGPTAIHRRSFIGHFVKEG